MILPSAWRSAEHDTASATGHDAPCRGKRITRTSWQKYLPPNWAPMPNCCVSASTFASSSTSRKPCPSSLPDVGSVSSECADASFAVFNVISAEVPPITSARWYGGHAAVPSVRSFSSSHVIIDDGLSSAFVSWNSRLLFAEPPPFAMNSSL